MAYGCDGSDLAGAEVSSLPTRIVAIAVLKDMLAEADTALRAEILAQMLPGDRQTAVVHGAIPCPSGHLDCTVDCGRCKGTGFARAAVPVGSITRKKLAPGGATAAVTDIDALVKWCETHAPTEVQTTVTVRPAFQKAILERVKAEGGWVTIHGELVIPDGVTRSPGAPSGGGLMVTKTDDGPDLIRAEITAGRLTFAAVLALPDGAA